MAWAQTLVLHVDDAVGHVCDYYDWSEFNCKQTPRVNHSFPKRSGKKKTPKNLRRRKSITKKKWRNQKPTNQPPKKYKWPDTRLTPSQPVRQKNSKKKTKKEKSFSAFGIYNHIQQNVVYVCPAFLSGWSIIHLSYFQSIEKNNTIPRTVTFVCLNFSFLLIRIEWRNIFLRWLISILIALRETWKRVRHTKERYANVRDV